MCGRFALKNPLALKAAFNLKGSIDEVIAEGNKMLAESGN